MSDVDFSGFIEEHRHPLFPHLISGWENLAIKDRDYFMERLSNVKRPVIRHSSKHQPRSHADECRYLAEPDTEERDWVNIQYAENLFQDAAYLYERWHIFLRWQRQVRGLETEEYSWLSRIEEELHRADKELTEQSVAEIPAWSDEYGSCIKLQLESIQRVRQKQHFMKEPPGKLDGYTKTLKRLFGVQGLKLRPDFRLSQDPKQQDKLTTWIEYLYFETWSAHQDTYRALEKAHNKAVKDALNQNKFQFYAEKYLALGEEPRYNGQENSMSTLRHFIFIGLVRDQIPLIEAVLDGAEAPRLQGGDATAQCIHLLEDLP
ncbi:hypothetical protein B0I35DRAFT_478762 [Stachybotrys elegans]|uniref:Uncharacterized protein n=1 Tax=Stachybotrys elegans TaxID=80388 RepID=A0A8K0WS86_9HYPO|nr:hypothetical protein B0I35DRAFT_478762 [Stachybotrys elegans]